MATKAPIVGATLQAIRTDLRMSEGDLVPSCASSVDLIKDWESETRVPSDRQVEKLSNTLRTPFAAFFSQRPPRVRRPRDRRAYTDRMLGDFCTETLFVFKTAAEIQFAFEYIDTIDHVDFSRRLTRLSLDDDPFEAGAAFRQQISLTRKQQKEWKADSAYRQWRRLVESFGIVTMQADLESDMLRGFCFPQPWPLICVNSADTSNGKCFSLLHELCHLMLGEDSASGYSDSYVAPNNDHERFCNKFANAAILPHANSFFQLELRKLQDVTDADVLVQGISRLARQYKVSRHVLLYALKSQNRVDESMASKAFAILSAASRGPRGKTNGGPLPPIKELSKRGELFSSRVLQALARGQLTSTEASAFLNLKPKWLPQVSARLMVLGANG